MLSFSDQTRASPRHGHMAWHPGDVQLHLEEDSVPSHPSGLPTFNLPREVDLHPDELRSQLRHRDGFSRDMTDAHMRYKAYSYDINEHLRKRENHTEDGKINLAGSYDDPRTYGNLDGIMSHRTVSKMHLYRGFGASFPIHNLRTGTEFTDHGYTGLTRSMVTSISHGHPHLDPGHPAHKGLDDLYKGPKYTGEGKLRGTQTIARVTVPPGSMGHLLDHPHRASYLDKEKEFTLHRGSRFRVLGHSMEAPLGRNPYPHPDGPQVGIHVVHLGVVGQNPKPLDLR